MLLLEALAILVTWMVVMDVIVIAVEHEKSARRDEQAYREELAGGLTPA